MLDQFIRLEIDKLAELLTLSEKHAPFIPYFLNRYRKTDKEINKDRYEGFKVGHNAPQLDVLGIHPKTVKTTQLTGIPSYDFGLQFKPTGIASYDINKAYRARVRAENPFGALAHNIDPGAVLNQDIKQYLSDSVDAQAKTTQSTGIPSYDFGLQMKPTGISSYDHGTALTAYPNNAVQTVPTAPVQIYPVQTQIPLQPIPFDALLQRMPLCNRKFLSMRCYKEMPPRSRQFLSMRCYKEMPLCNRKFLSMRCYKEMPPRSRQFLLMR